MAKIREDLSTGKRIYVETKYGEPVVKKLKCLGAHWDATTKCWWLGVAKKAEVIALLAEKLEEEEPKKEDARNIRLVGKALYKGKIYYCRFLGETKKGYSARLVNLDQSLDFWAPAKRPGEKDEEGFAVLIKTYQHREYRGRLEYTTLGSIQAFVEKEKKNRESGGEVCAECGKSGVLVQDLEDGMMKHRHCCDIES